MLGFDKMTYTMTYRIKLHSLKAISAPAGTTFAE
jgi:hypothetical protein